MLRRKGFTLIELLVVIAIIGILAAMLFPVFARARESARKTQCLANVKNIAIAINMYFTDYDRFPPAETDANVNAFFRDCGGDTAVAPGCCSTQANPYLRWPVLLDDYTKNRQIWTCPSAKLVTYPKIIVGDPNWFNVFVNGDPTGHCPCGDTWPPGWGGEVTDTDINSDTCVSPGSRGKGEISFGIAMYETNLGQSVSVIDDAAKYVMVGDAVNTPFWGFVEMVAYPDICRIRWANNLSGECTAQWENPDCSGSVDCGIPQDLITKFWTDPTYRTRYTRHLGGSNLGFADGHAKWYKADAIMDATAKGDLTGLIPQVIPSDLTITPPA